MLICKNLSLFKVQPGNLNAIPTLEKICNLPNLIPGRIDQHMNIAQLQFSFPNLPLLMNGLLVFTGVLIPGNVKLWASPGRAGGLPL
jgi:hypothetical protein